ncbi:TRAP transporter large permease subunit [Alkalibaculum sp. M08DMB]|uniref:TRAP transporter large permease subunit n=1 Tax=Alkalibaculum sporogenes TaxID=2655001 RepID=A0A6A7K811_9FIRM|nr:TRAP transporter large permease [Alkalibaculum sporogenes]MPW25570.1 TRAP transporter large permease subunit [Alkalibaculum sporogenes]
MSSGVVLIFIILAICMFIGVPIGVSLGVATAVTMVLTTNLNVLSIAQNCFGGLDSFPLMAIPFFILAGNLMKYGGISKRLLEFSNSVVGSIKGGLGMVSILSSMFFAAISGSAPATVTAIGSITIPEMKEKQYDEGYATALIAASGTIGIIIPPSIPFVIYGVISGASIGGLFMAGVIPGLLIGVGLMVVNYFVSKKNNYGGNTEVFSFKRVLIKLKEAAFALLCPVIILGGIYGGIFTPTESAVVGIVYSILVGAFIYKELRLKDIYQAMKETVLINGSTTFMIGLSLAFASYLTMAQVPVKIANAILGISDQPVVIYALIILLLLVVGCFIDNISSCVILTPILLPIVTNLGMDVIQFGVVMTVALAIGFITPPYGANLFFASAISNVSVEVISRKIGLFIFVMLIILFAITYIPSISMWLPGLLIN